MKQKCVNALGRPVALADGRMLDPGEIATVDLGIPHNRMMLEAETIVPFIAAKTPKEKE